MKATFNKTELLKELQKVQPFVRKTTIPILRNFLLCAKDDTVTITGTDLDSTLSVAIAAQVETEGKCTVPARKLTECIKTLKTIDTADVIIESDDKHFVTVTCGPLNVRIPGMSETNFPTVAAFPEKALVEIAAEVLDGLIARTMYAISTQESRYTNGALLVITPNGARMVTTDGHRLANVAYATQYDVKETRTLIARAALAHLQTILGESSVTIAKGESCIFFRAGNWTMVSRILTGQFPNYGAVTPTKNRHSALLKSSDLRATLGRIRQFSDERSRAIKFAFAPGKGVTLSASCTEAGAASELVPADYNGDAVTIGLNADYVLDVLGTFDKAGIVNIQLRDAQSAVMLVPAEANEYQAQNIVMPIRI
jgi:DNA polymerase-3 subunit beta